MYCLLFSQTFDIDLKLRNLTDAMYLLTSPLPVLSVIRRIKRTIVLVQPNQESEGRIADSLAFVPFFMNIFGAKAFQLTWIPRWAKYFSTDSRPALSEFTYNNVDFKALNRQFVPSFFRRTKFAADKFLIFIRHIAQKISLIFGKKC